ncbi:MAG: proprotein convertase P-domain-containing protein [Rivularia sp. (in: cyanobacteria)]|jgi:uncharacterized repeat protein (TIGR01451 family)
MKFLLKYLVSVSNACSTKIKFNKKTFPRKLHVSLGHIAVFFVLFLSASPKALAETLNDAPSGGRTFNASTQRCSNNQFLVRTFNVTSNFSVGSVSLGLNVSHVYRGAIAGLLQSPSGTVVQFLNINASDQNDNYDVLFRDGGGAINDGNNDAVGSPFYDRTVNPNAALSTFAGESASGTWRLYLCDGGSSFTGTYNRSQLTVLPISISGFAFDDVNRDNTRGTNETTLANIGVIAYRDDGDGVYEPGTDDVQVATSQTANNGAYAFGGLANGNYWVDVDETDADLAGRTYGGSAATNTADPRLVSFSGTTVSNVDFPFYQDLEFICEPGDPNGELTFLDGAVLESGNNLQIGAVYRFSDVFENVDALVEVVAFNGGATLAAIDNDTTGVSAAFQPTLNAVANTTASVDFTITLVEKGTQTPVTLSFRAAGVDIDGNGQQLREFIELTNLTSYKLTNNTTLTASTISSGNRFESNTTAAQPGVSATATQTLVVAQYDSVSQFRYRIGGIDAGSTGALQRLNSLYVGCTSGPPIASNPNLILVKRITAINGNRTENPNDNTPLNAFVDDTASARQEDDNNPNWPSDFLIGAINAGKVKPNDELEYTIYFLSSGDKPITNANVCDMIPTNTTYVPESMQLVINSNTTNLTDGFNDDAGEFFTSGNTPTVPCPTDNGKGAVVINAAASPAALPNSTAPGTPADSYGYIRFRVKVD